MNVFIYANFYAKVIFSHDKKKNKDIFELKLKDKLQVKYNLTQVRTMLRIIYDRFIFNSILKYGYAFANNPCPIQMVWESTPKNDLSTIFFNYHHKIVKFIKIS